DAIQRFLHNALHADLVDVAHVVDVETAVAHEPLLAGIDRANADLADAIGRDGRRAAAELGQFLRTIAAQARDWHTVDVAGRRQHRGIEIGMRVEPQDTQLLAGRATMLRDRRDRA